MVLSLKLHKSSSCFIRYELNLAQKKNYSFNNLRCCDCSKQIFLQNSGLNQFSPGMERYEDTMCPQAFISIQNVELNRLASSYDWLQHVRYKILWGHINFRSCVFTASSWMNKENSLSERQCCEDFRCSWVFTRLRVNCFDTLSNPHDLLNTC